MQVFTNKSEVRAFVTTERRAGQSVGMVPTMGYLHDGHMALVHAATGACDTVIASIFVNPTQFGPNEDLDTYPRDTDRDLAMLKAAGVDAVFMPEVDEMYNTGNQTIVDAPTLSRILIGRIRPGHFRGVATVVTKLLNIVAPDQAYFGEKDYQQLVVIKTLVRDLDIPVEIIGVPTVREADGLAMSSRNVRLNAADRVAAPILSRALHEAERLVSAPISAPALRRKLKEFISAEPRATLMSVDIRDAGGLAAVRGKIVTPVVILLAVRFGDVLLIDQRVVTP